MIFSRLERFLTLLAIPLIASQLTGCSTVSDTEAALGRTQQRINDGQLETGQDSVVVLYHTSEGVMCTGTIIGQRVVLTAKHCVRPNQGSGPGAYSTAGWTVNIGPNLNQIYDQYGVQEVRYPDGPQVEDNDIAVMLIAGVMSQPSYPLYGALDSGFEGDSVYLIGYGVNSCFGGSSGTKYRTTDQVVQFYGNNSFITQGQGANQGDSGGPVFNTNYEVVGVMVAISNCTDGITICTRVDRFQSLIQKALADTGECYPTGEEICGDGVDNDCQNGIDDGCTANGEPCSVNGDCIFGWCVNLGSGLVCAESCDDPATPQSGCPPGSYCAELECGVGVCRPGTAGDGAFGSQCISDRQCASLYCRPATSGTYYCGVPCEPNRGQCLPEEVCTPQGGICGSCQSATLFAGQRGLGELCVSNAECTSGLCMEDIGLFYCSQVCALDPDCPQGFHCRATFCVWGNRGADGDPCVNNDDCVAPATCYSDGKWSYCAQMGCEGGTVCPPHMVCDTVGQTGVCALTAAPVGVACNSAADCQSGTCVQFDGDGFCTTSCDRDHPCPSSTFCTVSDTGAMACAPNSTPSESPDPDNWVGVKGGCSSAGGGHGLVWGMLGLLLVGLRRRRKHRKHRKHLIPRPRGFIVGL